MIQYAVLKGGSDWDVFVNAQRFERHGDRLEAIEAAYALATAAETSGHRVELLVQDEGGELETWTVATWPGFRKSVPTAVPA